MQTNAVAGLPVTVDRAFTKVSKNGAGKEPVAHILAMSPALTGLKCQGTVR